MDSNGKTMLSEISQTKEDKYGQYHTLPPSKNLPPSASGKNTETPAARHYAENETLELSAIKQTSPSNTSPQGQGTLEE